MSQGDLRRRCCVVALMGLILLGTAVVPIPALADTIQYTYTGNLFQESGGDISFPSSPGVGNNVTVVFTHDGYLALNPWPPANEITIGDFVISCGPLSFRSTDYQPGARTVWIDNSGNIIWWYFAIQTSSTSPYYILKTRHMNSNNFGTIDAVSYDAQAEMLIMSSVLAHGHYSAVEWSGSWSAVDLDLVPVPATALLLGSGLLGLAGWRRFRKG